MGRAAASAVHGHAANAEVVEDRGEVVRVLDEAPARESRGDAEPGALDGDHPQSALHPGRWSVRSENGGPRRARQAQTGRPSESPHSLQATVLPSGRTSLPSRTSPMLAHSRWEGALDPLPLARGCGPRPRLDLNDGRPWRGPRHRTKGAPSDHRLAPRRRGRVPRQSEDAVSTGRSASLERPGIGVGAIPTCRGRKPAGGLPWTSRDHRPERLRPPPHPLGVQPARRAGADHRPRRHVGQARVRQPRRHRPRRALRLGRVLPGGHQGGHQADHRRRDLRRPAVDARQGGQGRQPALPPRPAGDGHDRLPEPVPAGHGRPHRRLLLQAPHRPRAPREAQPGPRRPVRLPRRRDPQGARGRTTGSSPASSPASTRTSSARTASSSSSRTTGSPSSAASTSSCCAWRPRPACRWSSPTTCTTSTRSSTRRTTSCCASARAATSTRRTGCASRARTSTSRPPRRCSGSSRTSARRTAQHAPDRRDGGPQAAAGRAAHPALPGARRRDGRDLAAQGVRGGPRPPLRRDHAGAPGAPGLRAGRDHLDGLRRATS